MNRVRVAELLRQIADELERPDTAPLPANDVRKRKRPPPMPVVPARLPAETDRAAARQELRRLGFRAGVKR